MKNLLQPFFEKANLNEKEEFFINVGSIIGTIKEELKILNYVLVE